MNTYLVNIEFKNGYRCICEFTAHDEDETTIKAQEFVADSTKAVYWWYIDRENPTITSEVI